jgi:hypothetical protein
LIKVIYYHKSKAAELNLLTQDNTKYSTISAIDKTFKTQWFLDCFRLAIFSLNSHLLARMAPRGCHQQWLPGEAALFSPKAYISLTTLYFSAVISFLLKVHSFDIPRNLLFLVISLMRVISACTAGEGLTPALNIPCP